MQSLQEAANQQRALLLMSRSVSKIKIIYYVGDVILIKMCGRFSLFLCMMHKLKKNYYKFFKP